MFKKQGVFYGYVPDVLQQAGRILNATFQISVTPDYRYGSFLDGNWTGMIGQLVANVSTITKTCPCKNKLNAIFHGCKKIFFR